MRVVWAALLVLALAGCLGFGEGTSQEPPGTSSSAATPATTSQTGTTPLPAQANATTPLRYAFERDDSITTWGFGYRLRSDTALDCYVNQTAKTTIAGSEHFWVKAYFLNGTANTFQWFDGGSTVHARAVGVDSYALPLPGLLGFTLGEDLRIRPEEGFQDLGVRWISNAVEQFEVSIACAAGASVDLEVAPNAIVWGVDSIEPALRVADQATWAHGVVPSFSLDASGDFYGYSAGATGQFSLEGPSPSDWALDRAGGFHIRPVAAGEHSASVERDGLGTDDAFWAVLADFRPVSDLGDPV